MRKQKDASLPDGVRDRIYELPEKYDLESCGPYDINVNPMYKLTMCDAGKQVLGRKWREGFCDKGAPVQSTLLKRQSLHIETSSTFNPFFSGSILGMFSIFHDLTRSLLRKSGDLELQ